MTEHVSPDVAAILDAFEGAGDGPVVMLNLNRYHESARYAPDHPHVTLGLSGREAYLHYGIVAQAAVQHVGGRILWAAPTREVVIGCDHDRYDEVIAVWYPNRAAFLNLPSYPGYDAAHVHREAALEQAMIVAAHGAAEPVLSLPALGG